MKHLGVFFLFGQRHNTLPVFTHFLRIQIWTSWCSVISARSWVLSRDAVSINSNKQTNLFSAKISTTNYTLSYFVCLLATCVAKPEEHIETGDKCCSLWQTSSASIPIVILARNLVNMGCSDVDDSTDLSLTSLAQGQN